MAVEYTTPRCYFTSGRLPQTSGCHTQRGHSRVKLLLQDHGIQPKPKTDEREKSETYRSAGMPEWRQKLKDTRDQSFVEQTCHDKVKKDAATWKKRFKNMRGKRLSFWKILAFGGLPGDFNQQQHEKIRLSKAAPLSTERLQARFLRGKGNKKVKKSSIHSIQHSISI